MRSAILKSTPQIALAVLLCVLGVSTAFADSDGFYCTGKGYIAFDLRSFIHPDLKEPHVLRLFRFDAERGIYKAAEWPMRDFQIHGMWCSQSRIVVAGSENARYVFDIDNHENRSPSTSDDEGASSLEGQLGWSGAGTTALDSSDPAHKYQLVLSNRTKDGQDSCTAELLQIDAHHKVSQRVPLYERDCTEYGD